MDFFFADTLGKFFYTVLAFVAGAAIGPALWKWVSAKFPWNK
jgi:hypothetical protein